MMPIVLRINSDDETFVAFYDSLATRLRGSGTVFTPYPVVPPNARMALPLPTNILVTLEDDDAFTAIYDTMYSYLRSDTTRSLTLKMESNTVVATSNRLPAQSDLATELGIS